ETENLALDSAEVRFAVSREHVGDCEPLARFDQLVDVFGAPPETRRQQPRDGRLSRRHEADEIDLVGRPRDRVVWCNHVRNHSLDRAIRSSSSKKPGYETLTASAPAMRTGPRARLPAMANAIASRWSP